MKAEIKIPAMGESISEATIGTLLKPTGSTVALDEEILELETDKVNQALFAPQAGVLTLHVKSGQKVKIGEVIGFVDNEGKESLERPVLKPALPKEAKESKKREPDTQEKRGDSKGARQQKEDFLKELEPTFKEEENEEEPFSPSFQQVKEEGTGERRETARKMPRIRQVIGTRLVQVLQETAMLTTFNEADMTKIMELREKYKEAFQKEHGAKLGYMSFFVKAVTSALKEYPAFNSYIKGEELVHREYFDIGVAVGTEKGLFVPVLRGCDKMSFAEIESAIEKFAQRAKDGTLAVEDLQGGGFTITNGGTYGSLLSTPILNPSQCGILGMHKIQKRAVVVEDEIVIRSMMYLALSYDHRLVDGKDAVKFLSFIKDHLEDPARLQLEIS